MQNFTSPEDINSSSLPRALGALIEHLLAVELSIAKTTILEPEDGAIFLLEDGDNDQILINQLYRPFTDILFEGIQHISDIDCYVCRFLRNNECCFTLIVPDEGWLPDAWRDKIMSELA